MNPEPTLQGGDRPDPSPEGDSLLTFLKDNLEAIAVAIVMALVIKHFCVEAFKIPTSSMRPTLHGEHDNPSGDGDRILVDKFAYFLESPERWHVIVFRYPLNQARNFIKRIAGLPGEHFQISDDGDIWVRPADDASIAPHIPQKPRHVRESFYRAVYPPAPPEPNDGEAGTRRVPVTLSSYWRVEGGTPNAWRLEALDDFVFAGGAAAALRNVPSILKRTTPRSWATSSNAGELVRDVRFRMRVALDAPAEAAGEATAAPTRFTLRWRPDDAFQAVLTLSSEKGRSEAFIRHGTAIVAQKTLDVSFAAGSTHDVELEYVDGRLRARIDDDECAVLADGRTFADTLQQDGEQRFGIEAEGGGLRVRDLNIERELRYGNSWDANPTAERSGIDIPEGHYFMLGDNTSNSSDSRRWRLVTIHLRDGRTIRYDAGDSPEYLASPAGELSMKRVVDADGLTRTWAEADEDPQLGSETNSAPFVDRNLIVGRAFLVFWPCWPAFPGRLGFIH